MCLVTQIVIVTHTLYITFLFVALAPLPFTLHCSCLVPCLTYLAPFARLDLDWLHLPYLIARFLLPCCCCCLVDWLIVIPPCDDSCYLPLPYPYLCPLYPLHTSALALCCICPLTPFVVLYALYLLTLRTFLFMALVGSFYRLRAHSVRLVPFAGLFGSFIYIYAFMPRAILPHLLPSCHAFPVYLCVCTLYLQFPYACVPFSSHRLPLHTQPVPVTTPPLPPLYLLLHLTFHAYRFPTTIYVRIFPGCCYYTFTTQRLLV